jgi:signal transduction histidine kinase/CheY-like chemotaxis protein
MKKLVQKIRNWILGNISRTDIPLAIQLGHLVCILAIIGGILGTVIKLLEGLSLLAGIVMAGSLALAGIFYVICVRLKLNKLGVAVCYFFGCMVCVPYTFLMGGGISSGLTSYFVLSVVLIFFMFHGRDWILPAILETLIFLTCIGVSYFFPSVIQGPTDSLILHLDNIQGVLICGLCIAGLVKFQIWAYQLQKEKAEAAARAKTDFLATMSHEIRTPMNAIIGLQDAVLREPLSETQRKYMHNLRMSSFALLDIVNNILDFSKIDAGGLVITESDFDLPALLDYLAVITEMAAGKNGLSFRTRFTADLPRFIRGDETKFRQILNNLLTNSIKYTPRGSVELAAELRRDEGRDLLCFEVRDTGIGIKDEDLRRIFSPFEQLDLRKNKGILGTGLGLAITRELCTAMKGSVEVESVYGQGSCFRVLLPCVESEGPEKAETGELQVFRAPEARVLVVDDVDINIMVAEAMLDKYKIVPDTALSGREALEKAAAKQYDLVFMDQMMPQMDGIETTGLLRKLSAHYAQAPIIALTANVLNTTDVYFRNLGFTTFLSKPIETEKLFKCLARYLPREKIVY